LSEYSKIEDNLRYFEVVIYTWYTSDIQVVYGRSEGDYGTGVEDAEGDVEEAAVDT
jgi:hypothetical protein